MRIKNWERMRDQKAEKSILSLVSEQLGIPTEMILGKTRKAHVVIARHMVIRFLRMRLAYSLELIGYVMKRDHSSIIHALRSANNMNTFYSRYREVYANINDILDGIKPYVGADIQIIFEKPEEKNFEFQYTISV